MRDDSLHHASPITAPQHQTHELRARHMREVGQAVETPPIPQPVSRLVMVALRRMAVPRGKRLGGGEVPRLSLSNVVELRLGIVAANIHYAMVQKPQRTFEDFAVGDRGDATRAGLRGDASHATEPRTSAHHIDHWPDSTVNGPRLERHEPARKDRPTMPMDDTCMAPSTITDLTIGAPRGTLWHPNAERHDSDHGVCIRASWGHIVGDIQTRIRATMRDSPRRTCDHEPRHKRNPDIDSQ